MAQSDPETSPGIPRWVKVGGLIVILLILLVIVLALTGVHELGGPAPGGHGPGMLTGVALLTLRPGPRRPAPWGDTAAGDVIQTEDGN